MPQIKVTADEVKELLLRQGADCVGMASTFSNYRTLAPLTKFLSVLFAKSTEEK